MKNVWILFLYEMEKIWKRPLIWASVLVCCGAFLYISPIPSYYSGQTFTATDAEGNEITRLVTAEEQRRAELEGSRALSGQPMDEAFFDRAHETIPDLDGQELMNAAQKGYFYLVDPAYCGVFARMGSLMRGSAERFYEWRQTILEGQWDYYKNRGMLTDEDASYWRQVEAEVEKPFIYEPVQGPERLLEVLGLLTIVVPILVGLCVCELFCQDHRLRTAPVVFSTSRGRFCLFWVKTLTGGLSSMLAVALVAGASTAFNLALYGTWGWNGAVQLTITKISCSWPITMWQAVLILVGLLMVYALLCGALVSAVSMWGRSGVAALAVTTAVTAGNMVLVSYWSPNPEILIEQLLYFRLPACFVNSASLINSGITHLLGMRLNWVQSGVLLYLGAAAVLLALCWLGWRRSAVSGA